MTTSTLQIKGRVQKKVQQSNINEKAIQIKDILWKLKRNNVHSTEKSFSVGTPWLREEELDNTKNYECWGRKQEKEKLDS